MTKDPVKSNLDALKKAVNAVTKDNKAWLTALEAYLESVDTSSTVTDPTQRDAIFNAAANAPEFSDIPLKGPPSLSKAQEAVRLTLDEVALLQYTDKKLGARVSQAATTQEGLVNAIKESEAYLLVTHDAFNFLNPFSTSIAGPDGAKIKAAAVASSVDRNALINQISSLQTTADSTAVEPEGTELLLGKSLGSCADKFLSLMPVSSKEFTQTQTLLQGGRLTLSDKQINALTNSWGKVVKKVSDDLAGTTPTFTIANLFCIHTTLETLYDRLETNVTRTDVDIVSLEI